MIYCFMKDYEIIKDINSIILEELTINNDVKYETDNIIRDCEEKVNDYTNIVVNLKTSDEKLRLVSEILYTLNETEVDSLINNMFSVAMNTYNDYSTVDNAIYNTETYKKLVDINKKIEKIKQNKQEFIIPVKTYGYNITEFIRKTRNLYKRFQRKFALCVKKIKNEIYGVEEGCVRINFRQLNENKINNKPMFYDVYRLL